MPLPLTPILNNIQLGEAGFLELPSNKLHLISLIFFSLLVEIKWEILALFIIKAVTINKF
jgi:hypothetical protein